MEIKIPESVFKHILLQKEQLDRFYHSYSYHPDRDIDTLSIDTEYGTVILRSEADENYIEEVQVTQKRYKATTDTK